MQPKKTASSPLLAPLTLLLSVCSFPKWIVPEKQVQTPQNTASTTDACFQKQQPTTTTTAPSVLSPLSSKPTLTPLLTSTSVCLFLEHSFGVCVCEREIKSVWFFFVNGSLLDSGGRKQSKSRNEQPSKTEAKWQSKNSCWGQQRGQQGNQW